MLQSSFVGHYAPGTCPDANVPLQSHFEAAPKLSSKDIPYIRSRAWINVRKCIGIHFHPLLTPLCYLCTSVVKNTLYTSAFSRSTPQKSPDSRPGYLEYYTLSLCCSVV